MKAKKFDEIELRSRIRSVRVVTSHWNNGVRSFNRVRIGVHCGEPLIALIVGESGTGKSALLDHLQGLHPVSRTADGLRREVVRLTTPHHATPISLMEAILSALDDPYPARGSREEKIERIGRLMSEQRVRLLMMDEFQHLVDKGQGMVLFDATECLKEIVIDSKIGVVVAGLDDAKKVINSNEQLKRRCKAKVFFRRYDWEDDESQDEYVGLLREFQRSVPEFEMPDLSGGEMALRMYLASGGIIDFVASILSQAIWNAIDDGRWKIALKDLKLARDEALWDDGALGENPFGSKYELEKDLESKIVVAKRINERVERPVSKRSASGRRHLAEIGL